MEMMFYGAAFLLNSWAAVIAINLFFRAQAYRVASGFFAISLILMFSRGLLFIFGIYDDQSIDIYDSILSLVISILMLISIFHFKKIVIELELKNVTLYQMSKLDFLTAALSRSETFTRSELEIERSFRNGHEISFLMLDIDHFKYVNDQYGHPAGDIVLANLVKNCQSQLRKIDLLGRVGGEEFFVILPESSEGNAHETAERLRSHVAKIPTLLENSEEIYITISIGIATFNPQKSSEKNPTLILKNFFEMSDIAMYSAKKAGRNQVVSWNASLN
jgi:diguanylate cyclase (GGDEF)-like protein